MVQFSDRCLESRQINGFSKPPQFSRSSIFEFAAKLKGAKIPENISNTGNTWSHKMAYKFLAPNLNFHPQTFNNWKFFGKKGKILDIPSAVRAVLWTAMNGQMAKCAKLENRFSLRKNRRILLETTKANFPGQIRAAKR